MHQNKHFRYYEYGPKKLDPIICLGGAACTADCFYKQVLALSSKVKADSLSF
jgi:maspardin